MSRFELRRILGVGGMGTVYEAFDRARARVVAVKTLQAFDPFQLYCLKNEFRALADVLHPNLVPLYELVHEDEQWWLVMERVFGRSVDQWVRGAPSSGEPALAAGALASRVRSAFAQIAEGLSALHRAGKLHRDLKPTNVLVEESGRALLLDFGLVVATRDLAEPAFMRRVGTAEYLAPERVRGEPASQASDMYALGVMLYEALTGFLPRNPRKLMVSALRPPSEVDAQVPPDLSELCCALLAEQPSDRPGAAHVAQWLRDQTVPSPHSSSEQEQELFLGRQAELAALHQAFAAAQQGALQLVLVEGESGLGKSALLDTFLQSLRTEREARIVTSRCLVAETSPYKGVDGLIDGLSALLLEEAERGALALPDGIDALATMFPVLRRVGAIDRALERTTLTAEPVRVRRRRAIDALGALCRELSARAPLVLCIDDVQWSDRDAAQLLVDLCSAEQGAPLQRVLLVLLAHPGAYQAPASFAPLASHPAAARLALGRLSPDEVSRLASAMLGHSVENELIERVASMADGHPIAVRELTVYLAQQNGQPGSDASFDLSDVVRARLSGLSSEERQQVELLALLGRPASRTTLDQLTWHTGSSDLVSRALCAQRFLRVRAASQEPSFELFHDRLRVAVNQAIPGEARPTLHARIAQVLSQRSDVEAELLSHHFEQAGLLSEAARYALRAGREALRSLAFGRAAAAFERVLVLQPELPREPKRALLLDLAVSYEGQGQPQRAAEVWLSAVDLADERADALLLESRAAEQWLVGGHVERGLNVLRRIAREVGLRIPESRLKATLEIILFRVRTALYARRARALPPVHERALLQLKTEATFSISRALGLLDMDLGVAVHARSLLYALKSGDARRLAFGLAWDASFRGALRGDADRGFLHSIVRAEGIAQELRDEQAIAWCALARGTTTVLSGKYHEGLVHLDQAHTLFARQPRGVAWELTMTRVVRAAALAWSGQLKSLTLDVGSWLREAEDRGDAYAGMVLRMRASNGIRQLARNRADELLHEVDDQLARWPRHPMVEDLSLRYGQFLRTFACLAQGRADAADAHLTKLRRDPARFFVYMPSALRAEHATLYGLVGLAVARPRLNEATKHARTLQRDPRPYGNALGGILLAAVALRQGSGTELARQALSQAEAACQSAGMHALADSAALKLGGLLGGEQGAALTQRAEANLSEQGVMDPQRFASFWLTPWTLST